MNTKQVIVIRKDLNMRLGKSVAQGSHASISFLTRKIQSNRKNESCLDFSKAGELGYYEAYSAIKEYCQ